MSPRRPRPGAHDPKIITAYLPSGRGLEVVALLHREMGVNAANVTSGRGHGMVHSISYGEWAELDILTVAVAANRADEVFGYIHEKAGLGNAGGGILLQAPLLRATSYELPAIKEEA